MLPPHIKRKKCKQKLYFLPHENMTHRRWCRRKKRERRERRRRKKEEGRHGADAGHRDPPLGLADRGSARPTVCFFFFFFFPFGDLGKDLAGRMKPTAGSRRKDLALDQTPRCRPTSRPTHRPPRPTAGSRRPWVLFCFFCFFSFRSDFFFFGF
jgi:hypothetical protein